MIKLIKTVLGHLSYSKKIIQNYLVCILNFYNFIFLVINY